MTDMITVYSSLDLPQQREKKKDLARQLLNELRSKIHYQVYDELLALMMNKLAEQIVDDPDEYPDE